MVVIYAGTVATTTTTTVTTASMTTGIFTTTTSSSSTTTSGITITDNNTESITSNISNKEKFKLGKEYFMFL